MMEAAKLHRGLDYRMVAKRWQMVPESYPDSILRLVSW